MTIRPDKFPDFALLDLQDPTSLQQNVTEPPQVFKDYGWHPFRMKPPRGWMNWLHRKTNEWLKYLDSQSSETSNVLSNSTDSITGYIDDSEFGSKVESDVNNNSILKIGFYTYNLASFDNSPDYPLRVTLNSFDVSKYYYTEYNVANAWSSIGANNGLMFNDIYADNTWYDLYMLYSLDPAHTNFGRVHWVAVAHNDPLDSSITNAFTHGRLITHIKTMSGGLEPCYIGRNDTVFGGQIYQEFSTSYIYGLAATELPLTHTSDTSNVIKSEEFDNYRILKGGNPSLPSTSGRILICDLIAGGSNVDNVIIQGNHQGATYNGTTSQHTHTMGFYDIAPGEIIRDARLSISGPPFLSCRNVSIGGNNVNTINVRIKSISHGTRLL